ncbi:aldehyde dehydrogenase [Aspergillus carlsbadensis]|nr:aldehyde dehydrogenase [Aspergillus carlsbadensis]
MVTTTRVGKLDFQTFSNVIDGQLSSTKDTRCGVNPATNQYLFSCPVSTSEDVDRAINAARAAFQTWKKTSVEYRKEQLRAFAAQLAEHKGEFSRLLTAEQGKPTRFAEQEIDSAVHWLVGTCELDLPEEVVEDSDDRYVKTRYTPLGVVVGIVPWNFPVMLLCGKLAPAVMTGNTIIIKPSPFTPYCGTKVVELAQHFFPPGVVQVLSGDDSLGPMLTAHPGIDKISFTGSTATGKSVMRSASYNLTRVTLELGGNDAAIVCPDVDVKEAAAQIANAVFLNAGQICIAIKRIYIHRDIYEPFRDHFVAHSSSLTVGNGSEDGVFMGPVQNRLQYDRVREFIADTGTNSHTVLTGGDTIKTPSNGLFIQPTVIDNPPDYSKIVVEEPFGPIVPLLQWSDTAEVVERVNASEMGLGASVWSKDHNLAVRIGEELDVGSVWFNEHLAIRPTAAFGGHKKSGVGAEWGSAGLRGFCNTQTLFLHRKPAA